jgi:cell division protein FtsL
MTRATGSLLVFMALAAIATGVASVHVKYLARKDFAKLQELRARRDYLDVEWNRLRLEEAALSTHVLVERKARDELGMYLPRFEDVLLIEEAGHGAP